MRRLIPISLLTCTLFAGCASKDNKITEMHVDNAGTVVPGDSYTRDELWMHQVNELVFNEAKGEKPPDSFPGWKQFWKSAYTGIRSRPQPSWDSTHFKDSEAMVTYIKQQRAMRKLPLYDDH